MYLSLALQSNYFTANLLVMKKRFNTLLFSLLFCCDYCAAQTEKGVLLLGGKGNFDFYPNGTNESTNIEIQPTIAKFVTKNLALGGVLGLSYNKTGGVQVKTFALTPMARYYFGNGFVRPFLVGQAGYAQAKVNDNYNPEYTSGGMLFTGGAGLVFFLTKSVGLETTIATSKGTGDINGAIFSLHFGMMAYLGSE